jgi:hypothetical protein
MLLLPFWCFDAKGGEVDLLGWEFAWGCQGLGASFWFFGLGIKSYP